MFQHLSKISGCVATNMAVKCPDVSLKTSSRFHAYKCVMLSVKVDFGMADVLLKVPDIVSTSKAGNCPHVLTKLSGFVMHMAGKLNLVTNVETLFWTVHFGVEAVLLKIFFCHENGWKISGRLIKNIEWVMLTNIEMLARSTVSGVAAVSPSCNTTTIPST